MVKLGLHTFHSAKGHDFAVKTSDFHTDKYFNPTNVNVVPFDDAALKEPYKLLSGDTRWPLSYLDIPQSIFLPVQNPEVRKVLQQVLQHKLQFLVQAIKRDLAYEDAEEAASNLSAVRQPKTEGDKMMPPPPPPSRNRYRKYRSSENDAIYAMLADPGQPLPVSIRVQSLIRHIVRLDRVIAKDVAEDVNDQGSRGTLAMYTASWRDVQRELGAQGPLKLSEAEVTQMLTSAIGRTFLESGFSADAVEGHDAPAGYHDGDEIEQSEDEEDEDEESEDEESEDEEDEDEDGQDASKEDLHEVRKSKVDRAGWAMAGLHNLNAIGAFT